MTKDVDDLHIEPFTVRYQPDDANLIRATARKLRLKPSVLIRLLSLRAMDSLLLRYRSMGLEARLAKLDEERSGS
jgi:hypothetical protein